MGETILSDPGTARGLFQGAYSYLNYESGSTLRAKVPGIVCVIYDHLDF
jgi:hypothetical protein